jgi:hypothetical protein
LHTHPCTLALFFSSSHFSFKHNSFSWKKKKSILHPAAEKNVVCPQPWLVAQELGLNEHRAGQLRVCVGPLLSRVELETGLKGKGKENNKAPEPEPTEDPADWQRCPHICIQVGEPATDPGTLEGRSLVDAKTGSG